MDLPRQILSDEAWTEMVEMKKHLETTFAQFDETEKNWSCHTYMHGVIKERLEAVTAFMKAFECCYDCNFKG